jgi:hypothetical protein
MGETMSTQLQHKNIRANLDYGKEVHWSITLREGINTIGYKMETSLAGVYTTAKSSLMKNIKHGRQHGNMLFGYGSSLEVDFLGQPQTLVE